MLRVNDAVNICFGLAKCRKYEGRPVQWTLRHRVRQPMGWTVAIRLGENNEAILDYILLPSFTRARLWFSEEHRPAHKIECFETFEDLTRSLVRRVDKATRSTQRSDSGQRRSSRGQDTDDRELVSRVTSSQD